ncbi:Aste57867_11631 [Aphanomyces stellatus]|uniref:Aste57867_11631 protein n=1 Tax=Aphanomyces stellatus TaxID=120398 RepID=A0A485KTI0_9STRA|nr:hypothetical protein As57867_011588 [Aphanomyces stellatus]VFT88489.1 Aste57867_11631 [Aphanomyces stellatus]
MRAVYLRFVVAAAALVAGTSAMPAAFADAIGDQLFACEAQDCRPNGSDASATVDSCLKACNGGKAEECKDKCVCSGTSPGSQCAGICRKNKTTDECGSPVRQKCSGADLVCDKSTPAPAPSATSSAPATTVAATTAVPTTTTAAPTSAAPATTDAPTTTAAPGTTTASPTTTVAATTAPPTTTAAVPVSTTAAPITTTSTPAGSTAVPTTTAAAAQTTSLPATTPPPATTDAATATTTTVPTTTAAADSTTAAPASTTSPVVTPAPVVRPPTPGKDAPVSPSAGGACTPVSVVGDATYCVRGAICGDTGSACPQKGDVASADCFKHLKSYVDAAKCVAPYTAVCQAINRSGVKGCVFDPSATTSAPPAAAPCTNVSVVGDATYCVAGAVCGGAGTNCPKKGAAASQDCWRHLRSYTEAGQCVAPVDGQCQILPGTISVLGCVFPKA